MELYNNNAFKVTFLSVCTLQYQVHVVIFYQFVASMWPKCQTTI